MHDQCYGYIEARAKANEINPGIHKANFNRGVITKDKLREGIKMKIEKCKECGEEVQLIPSIIKHIKEGECINESCSLQSINLFFDTFESIATSKAKVIWLKAQEAKLVLTQAQAIEYGEALIKYMDSVQKEKRHVDFEAYRDVEITAISSLNRAVAFIKHGQS